MSPAASLMNMLAKATAGCSLLAVRSPDFGTRMSPEPMIRAREFAASGRGGADNFYLRTRPVGEMLEFDLPIDLELPSQRFTPQCV
jgi:hypothetical protein